MAHKLWYENPESGFRASLARDILLKLIENCSLSALKGGEPGVRRIDLQLSPHGIEEREPPPGSFAAYAVSLADALLAELAKPKEG